MIQVVVSRKYTVYEASSFEIKDNATDDDIKQAFLEKEPDDTQIGDDSWNIIRAKKVKGE